MKVFRSNDWDCLAQSKGWSPSNVRLLAIHQAYPLFKTPNFFFFLSER